MSDNILIVGAGFAGAVYARQLAEKDYHVTVIDKRDHIAGNCYDYVDDTGIRIHKYGPHLFHTSNMAVFDYLSRFTKWVKYEHKVVVRVGEKKFVPLPINIQTINTIFNKSFESEEDVKSFVHSLSKIKRLSMPKIGYMTRLARDLQIYFTGHILKKCGTWT